MSLTQQPCHIWVVCSNLAQPPFSRRMSLNEHRRTWVHMVGTSTSYILSLSILSFDTFTGILQRIVSLLCDVTLSSALTAIEGSYHENTELYKPQDSVLYYMHAINGVRS